MNNFNNPKSSPQRLTIEMNGTKIENVAEKAGSLLGGHTGSKIGRAIDNMTKDITIKVDTKTRKTI